MAPLRAGWDMEQGDQYKVEENGPNGLWWWESELNKPDGGLDALGLAEVEGAKAVLGKDVEVGCDDEDGGLDALGLAEVEGANEALAKDIEEVGCNDADGGLDALGLAEVEGANAVLAKDIEEVGCDDADGGLDALGLAEVEGANQLLGMAIKKAVLGDGASGVKCFELDLMNERNISLKGLLAPKLLFSPVGVDGSYEQSNWLLMAVLLSMLLGTFVAVCLAKYGATDNPKSAFFRAPCLRIKNWAVLLILAIDVQSSSGANSSNFVDVVMGFTKAWANHTVDCWDEKIEEFKEDVIDPLNSRYGYYSYEFDNVDGCNIIPTQRTQDGEGVDSKFNFFQPNSIFFQSLDFLIDMITCPFQAIAEAAEGGDIDFDLSTLIEDLLFGSEDIPLIDLVAEEECDATVNPVSQVLGFEPVPFKDGWTSITLDDDTCVQDDCDDIGNFCCDREHSQAEANSVWVESGTTVESYQCIPSNTEGDPGSCSRNETRCVGVGATCEGPDIPTNIPCCHVKDDVAGGVWYVDCGGATDSSAATCQDPDTTNNEPDCIASGYECTSDSECCQYSGDSLIYSNVMVCYKDATESTGVCQKRSQESYSFEPFCLAWNAGGPLDTFGFAFPGGFPPLPLEPTGLAFQILPTKGEIATPLLGPSSESICKLHRGVKIADITSIGAVLLFKFIGVAGSSSGRLEYGANKFTRNMDIDNHVPLIWDGFLSIPLEPHPGVDFWMSFQLELYPLPNWTYGKLDCTLGGGFDAFADSISSTFQGSAEAQSIKSGGAAWHEFFLKAVFELYVDGGGDDSEACVVATMSSLEIGVSAFSIIIGRAIGGWCKHSYPASCDDRSDEESNESNSSLPIFDDECKNECDPSGFFMNVEPTLEFGGVPGGVLEALMYVPPAVRDATGDEESTNVTDVCEAQTAVNENWEEVLMEDAEDFFEEEIDLQGGFSVGVFLDDDDDVKAVVLRLETPQLYVFGIPVNSLSFKVHFQWFKGSEMERRRGSILRIEVEPGEYHVNCPITTHGCEVWKPYKRIDTDTGLDEWNDQVEICEDVLWDLDDYNRVLMTQVADPSEVAFGDPPMLVERDTAPSQWYVNPQFDLSPYPDSGVTFVYVQCSLWLLGPLVTLDNLSFFIAVNTLKPEDLITTVDENATADMINQYNEGNVEDAYSQFEDQLDAQDQAVANRKAQNVYIQITMEVTALFFFTIRGSAVLRNNPLGNEDWVEWIVQWHVSTFSRIIPDSPWDWEAFGTTELFQWDNADLELSEERFLEEFTPPSVQSTIEFQFFGLSLSEIWDAIVEFWDNTILPALTAIKDAIVAVMEEIGNFIRDMADAVATFFEPMANAIDECTDIVELFTKDGRQECADAVGDGIDFYGDIWDGFVGLFQSGGFFDNIYQTVTSSDFWEDLGLFLDPCKRGYIKYRRITSDPNSCKDSCGSSCGSYCHDEYLCPIRYRQKSECIEFRCNTNKADECEDWQDDFSVDPIYDYECQEDVLESIAMVDELNAEATSMSDSVDENEEYRIKGLQHAVENPESRPNTDANVGSEKFLVANLDGSVPEIVSVSGSVDELPVFQADDINPRQETNVGLSEDIYVDFLTMSEEDVRASLTTAFNSASAQKATSETALSEDVQAYSPEIEAPVISFAGSLELVLDDCADGTNTELSAAWSIGIAGVSAYLKQIYLPDIIAPQITVELDPQSPSYVLRWARTSHGFGCNELEVTYEVNAVSGTLNSNTLVFTIKIPYGETTIVTNSERNQTVQTTCRNDPYDSESLQRYNMDIPALSGDCPNPDIILNEDDSIQNEGTPCTKEYTVIHRTWSLESDSGACSIPSDSPTHMQVITLGGQDSDFFDFNVTNATYELSNEENNGSATFELATIYDEESANGACGDLICSVTTSPAPFIDGNVIGCEQLGDNEVTVEVLTDVGALVSKQVTVTVVDIYPPVLLRTMPATLIDLDSTGHADVSATDEIIGNLFQWHDNCGVVSTTLEREASRDEDSCNEDGSICTFSCEDTYDGGPSDVSLLVQDSSNNTVQESVPFYVVDSSDRDGDSMRDCAEELIFFTDPDAPTRRCPEEYSLGTAYSPGDVVSKRTKDGDSLVYRCTSDIAAALWCGMAGFAPGSGFASEQAWTVEGSCDIIRAPTSAPHFDVLPDLGYPCPKEWEEKRYQPGDHVSFEELVFECLTASGRCGQQGYQPIESSNYWKDAWTIVGHCSVAAKPCPREFSSDASYEAGDLIAFTVMTTFERNFVYECARAEICSLEGFEPRSDVSEQLSVWIFRDSCSNATSISDLDVSDFIGGCPVEFSEAESYEAGDRVEVNGMVFECIAGAYSASCSQAGFEPMSPDHNGAWKLSWEYIGRCSGTVQPTSSPVFAGPVIEGCPAEYIISSLSSGKKYAAGEQASYTISRDPERKLVYECLGWPWTPHCTQYAPGSQYGYLAWKLLGACEGSLAPSAAPTPFDNALLSGGRYRCDYQKCRDAEVLVDCTYNPNNEAACPSAGCASCAFEDGTKRCTQCTKEVTQTVCSWSPVNNWGVDPPLGDIMPGDVVRVGARRFKAKKYPYYLFARQELYRPKVDEPGLWTDAWLEDGKCSPADASEEGEELAESS